MAKKPTPAPKTTAVANWDEELAKLAGAGASLTNSTSGGRFFSTQAGILSYDDTPLPGNQMCVIIGSWCLENVYYGDTYDPDNRKPPLCFAFHKDPETKDEMAPDPEHLKDDAFEQQNDDCASCEQNQWGSAAQGRGKACGNRRRLALLAAGTYTKLGKGGGFDLELIEDADHFKSAEEAYLKLPVMSGKGFDGYVKQVAEQLKRPLFAVYTRVWIEPDPKSQFRVMFELIEPVDNSLMQVLFERHKKLYDGIDFPYTPMAEEDAPATTGRSASAGKKLAGKKPPAKKR